MANSPNLGYSVGSWKELDCTWSDSCPGKTRDSACPGPAESWSTKTPCCGLGCWLSSLCSEHMKQRTDSKTHSSVLQFAAKLALLWLLDSVAFQGAPCHAIGLQTTCLGSENVMCRRASLSFGIDTMPLSPSLRKNSWALWCQLWKTLKVPNCNGKSLFIFLCYAVLSELMFIDKLFCIQHLWCV